MVLKKNILMGLPICLLVIAGCGLFNSPPDITLVTASSTEVESGDVVSCAVVATDPDGDELTYTWSATGGSFDETSGLSVVWTAPEVTEQQTYTITVVASDPDGATDTASVDIVVSPTGDGPDGVYVVVGDTLMDDLWSPFNNGEYGRTQCIYYASEIGRSGTITGIATMASTQMVKDFNNFKIWLLEVSGTELTDTLDNNWEGGTLTLLYQSTAERYGDPDDDWRKWHQFEFASDFAYDGTSNLLVEFEFEGYTGHASSVGSYAFDVDGSAKRHVSLGNPNNVFAIPNPGAVTLRFTFEE